MKIKSSVLSALLLFVFLQQSAAIEEVVILGSGPAGLTAAIYSSRAGLETLVIEGNEPGGQITLSYHVENFPGFPDGINGYELIENMQEQALRFGTRIQSGEIVEADLQKRPFVLTLDSGDIIHTQSLIIASGSSAKWLGVPSEKALIGKGISSCAVCDGYFYKGQDVVVVGGGDTALEDALFLAQYASKVTVIHRRDTLKASKFLQDKAKKNPSIHFIWESIVEEINDPEMGKVTSIVVKNLNIDVKKTIPCQGVFVAIGHSPNISLFKDQLNVDEKGYIVTESASTATSVPGVFAAGDVADKRYRQAITAAGSGCMAGIDVYHFIQKQTYHKVKP